MSRKGWALFLALSVIWGVPYLLIKVAVDSLHPSVVVFLRTLIGAALLLPIAGCTGRAAAHAAPMATAAAVHVRRDHRALAAADRG